MSIGDTITEPIPPVSTAGTGYASQLVAFLQEVKARLEARVPLSSLLPGLFDLDNNAIENAQYVGLYEQTDTSSEPVGSILNYQGNLWYVSASGAAQITSGSSLNAAGIGGINGDYGGANPASVYFSDADQTYSFYDDGGTLAWARIAARSIDIYGTLTETERVRITWGGGSNWTLTLPTAPPAASGTILQMDTSGNVTVANTGLDAVALASNENFTVSGTGGYKHGEKTLNKPFMLFEASGGSTVIGTNVTFRSGGAVNPTDPGVRMSSSTSSYFPLPQIPAEKRVKSIKIYLGAAPTGNITYTFALVGIAGILAFADGTDTTTSSASTVTLTLATPYTLDNASNSGDVVPYLKVATDGATLAHLVQMRIIYDEA